MQQAELYGLFKAFQWAQHLKRAKMAVVSDRDIPVRRPSPFHSPPAGEGRHCPKSQRHQRC